MANKNVSISGLNLTYIKRESKKFPLNIFMLVESESYPDYPYGIVTDSDLTKFNSYNYSESYTIAKELQKLGCNLFLYGLNHFQNKISCRIFNNGIVSHPDINKKYQKIYSEDDEIEDGIYYIKYVLPTDTFKYGDIILVNPGKYKYLIWYGNQYQNTIPIPLESYYREFKVSTDQSLSDQIKKTIDILENVIGFNVTYENNTITIYKYSKFPYLNFSSLKTITDDRIKYDILCNLYEDKKVIDFWSNYNTVIQDLGIEIASYFDNYVINVYRFDKNGSIIDSEKLIANLDKNSSNYIENVINNRSRLIRCKLYDPNYNLVGYYKLDRIPLKDELTFNENLWELTIDTIKFEDIYPDIIIDSGIKRKTYHDRLKSLIGNRSILFLNSTYNYNNSYVTLFSDSLKYNNIILPSYVFAIKNILNGKYGGVIDKEAFINSSDNINNEIYVNSLNIDPFKIYFDNLITSSKIPLRVMLPVAIITNYLSKNTYLFNDEDTIKNFINQNKNEIILMSNNGIKNLSIESFSLKDRDAKIILRYDVNDEYYKNIFINLNFEIQGE